MRIVDQHQAGRHGVAADVEGTTVGHLGKAAGDHAAIEQELADGAIGDHDLIGVQVSAVHRERAGTDQKLSVLGGVGDPDVAAGHQNRASGGSQGRDLDIGRDVGNERQGKIRRQHAAAGNRHRSEVINHGVRDERPARTDVHRAEAEQLEHVAGAIAGRSTRNLQLTRKLIEEGIIEIQQATLAHLKHAVAVHPVGHHIGGSGTVAFHRDDAGGVAV